MLLVEDTLGARKVNDLLGPLVPRQGHQPVEIRARDRVLGRGHRHPRQPFELACGFFLHRLGHSRRVDLLAKLLDLFLLVVVFPQFLLDGLELLAQEIIALVLADLRLHLGLDLRPELEDLEFLDKDPVQAVHPGAHVEGVEDFLLGRGADGAQTRRDEVGQAPWLFDADGERLQIVGQQRRQRHDLLEAALDVAQQRVDLEMILVALFVGNGRDLRAQIRLHRDDLVEANARQALHDEAKAAVGQPEHLVDMGGGANRIEVGLQRFVERGIALREDADQLAVGDGFVDQPHRTLTRHRQRHERVRKQHRVAQREHGQFGWNDGRTIVDRDGGRFGRLGNLVGVIAHGDPSAETRTKNKEGSEPLVAQRR